MALSPSQRLTPLGITSEEIQAAAAVAGRPQPLVPSRNGGTASAAGAQDHAALLATAAGAPGLLATAFRDPIPLRVCMLVSSPFPANHGTPGSIREMAEALVDRGHEVHVVTYHFGEDLPVRGIQIHRIPAITDEQGVIVGPTIRKPLYDLFLVFKTLQFIARYKPDVLNAHNYEAALAAWICYRLTGVPVVYNAHNTMASELASYDFIRPKWLAQAFARLLDVFVPRLADTCLPHGAGVAACLQQIGLRTRTRPVLKVGIDVAWVAGGNSAGLRVRYGLGSGPVVLYTGLVDEFQRLDILVSAMARIRRQIHTAKLLLVQTIPNPRQFAAIRKQAAELGLGDSLIVTDPQPLSAVRDFLQVGDVGVSPRPDCPGLPFKIMNYFAARLPTILFASSAIPGLADRDNAVLVRPDTPGAFADAVLEVLGNPTLARRVAENGYRFVLENHDRKVTARQLAEACYDALAKTGRLAGPLRRLRQAEALHGPTEARPA
jgi:glycosyltransferase involved in cell wall biosynthesis